MRSEKELSIGIQSRLAPDMEAPGALNTLAIGNHGSPCAGGVILFIEQAQS